MSKCRILIQENQELGKQVSTGRTAQLEAELALQKKYSEELKASQDGEFYVPFVCANNYPEYVATVMTLDSATAIFKPKK